MYVMHATFKAKPGQAQALADKIAACTKYAHIVRGAPVSILVFLDTGASYHREKDIQAVGTISANNDPEIGKLLADAMEKVGKDGVIRGWMTA